MHIHIFKGQLKNNSIMLAIYSFNIAHTRAKKCGNYVNDVNYHVCVPHAKKRTTKGV